MTLLLLGLVAYLVGSINVAILVSRFARLPDPRKLGSRNPGVTNVYRLAGPVWAGVVLGLDLGRAAGLALAARATLPADGVPWVGLLLLAGNRWPLWHGLRGGKGVAAMLGFTLPVAPVAAGLGGVAYLVGRGLGGPSFVGSFAMVAVLATGLLAVAGGTAMAALAVLAMVLMVIWAHRPNLGL